MYFTNRLIFRKFLKDGSRELQEERLRICVTWVAWGRRHFGEVVKVPRCLLLFWKN